LDVQDFQGDTVLHLSSRMGHKEITSAICEEDNCDPLAKRNNKKELPIDIARSHIVFQIIKICSDRNQLRRELAYLKSVS